MRIEFHLLKFLWVPEAHHTGGSRERGVASEPWWESFGLCSLLQMWNIPEPLASSMTSLQSATTSAPFSKASGRT